MNRSLGISAAAHVLALLAAMFSGQLFRADPAQAIQITEVEVLSSADFEAAVSTAPEAPPEALPVLTAPTQDSSIDAPSDTVAPEIAESARPGSDTADDAPDMAGLRNVQPTAPVTQALALPAPQILESAPAGASLITPQMVGPSVAPSARQQPNVQAFAPPAPPVPAPRISTTPAEKPPSEARQAEETTPEVAPDPEATEQAEERPPEAPPEAATEIVPEVAEETEALDAPAPLASAPPPRRPEREVAELPDEPAADPPTETPAETPAETPTETPVGTENEPEPETETASAPPPAAAPAASPASDRPAGPPVTQREKDGITLPIRNQWNFATLRGVEGWEELVVEVRFSVSPDGKVSNLRPHNPTNPQGNFQRAYALARSAILIAERRGLLKFPPQDKYERWKDIIITFDPKTQRVGF
ncbi:MAG: hypothetical protein AAGE13_12445 [Pseudomonadota bacterium]